MKKKLLTVKQAAEITGRTSNTMRIWLREGKLKAVKEKGVWMIDPEILNAMVETSEQIRKAETVVTKKPSVKRKIKKLPQSVSLNNEDNLREDINVIRKEMLGLKTELSEAVKKIKRLTHEIEKLRTETESLRTKEEKQKENIHSILGPLAPLVEKILGF